MSKDYRDLCLEIAKLHQLYVGPMSEPEFCETIFYSIISIVEVHIGREKALEYLENMFVRCLELQKSIEE